MDLSLVLYVVGDILVCLFVSFGIVMALYMNHFIYWVFEDLLKDYSEVKH
jgi:hypothetical protein